ncbi:MAG: hypothetical protein IIW88_00045 [Clostridia bacterium]|nr:hypothetical protein [Clostridia bacterium]
MSKILSLVISLILLVENLPLFWNPVLEIDAAKPMGEVTTKATGFLYGLAEPGVPSEAITDSLDISSVSQKVIGGLQHPTGDADRLKDQLTETDYIVVYLQDAFDTWYYAWEEIGKMRENGTYDWKEYITETYFPIVREKVTALRDTDYADKLVYCIYNECDNGVWFGNYVDGWAQYDEIGRQNFYEGWKMTYDLVKSLDPDAMIGGPGFCDYETTKMEGFMSYCKENDCVPEIMIYHELADWSTTDWKMHVDDYRRIENENNVNELPIIVTEYGTMEQCGNPSQMIHYIYEIERTGTYGNMAYWRLSNNLNDTTADDNTPNSNWWLYRKYAEMDGQLLEVKVDSLKDRHKHDGNWRRDYKGIASITDNKDEINILAVGSDNARSIEIRNLKETNLGKKVDVKVECVYYNGLNTPVYAPITLRQYTVNTKNKLTINIPGTDTDAVYFVTVTPHDEETKVIRNQNIPVRYEFEEGKLLGTAYTYDSAYATTGEIQGMVGGIEKIGDGVRIKIKAPEKGRYKLDIIYGKHNDSGIPQGRDFATANFTLDGKTTELKLPNTIKSEYTSLYSMTLDLSMGKHTIEFTHNDGTYVLDSMLLYKDVEKKDIEVLSDSENNTEFLAVAPYDGWFEIYGTEGKATAEFDGVKREIENGTAVYLRRGLNEIKLSSPAELKIKKTDKTGFSTEITAKEMALSDGAELITDKYGNTFVDSISNLGGKAEFIIDAPEKGDYRVTLTYANNAEGGVHSYNVDLIERYATFTVNGESQDVYCRNTFSRYNFKTVTFTLSLEKGENAVSITNSGSYLFNGMTAYAPQIASLTVNGK